MTDKPKVQVTDGAADHVLMKRGLYYCPNNAGYTGRKDRAGLYSASDARPDCGITAIPFDKAPLFAPKCWDEVKVEYYEERIAAEQSRDDVIEECARALEKRADCHGDKEQTMYNAMYWREVQRCAKALRAMKGKKS